MGGNWVQDHLLAMRAVTLIVRAVASRMRMRLSRTFVTAGVLLLLMGQWAPPAHAKNLLFYRPSAYAEPDKFTEATVAAAQGHTATLADAAQGSRYGPLLGCSSLLLHILASARGCLSMLCSA